MIIRIFFSFFPFSKEVSYLEVQYFNWPKFCAWLSRRIPYCSFRPISKKCWNFRNVYPFLLVIVHYIRAVEGHCKLLSCRKRVRGRNCYFCEDISAPQFISLVAFSIDNIQLTDSANRWEKSRWNSAKDKKGVFLYYYSCFGFYKKE